jgi:hypothetical protein
MVLECNSNVPWCFFPLTCRFCVYNSVLPCDCQPYQIVVPVLQCIVCISSRESNCVFIRLIIFYPDNLIIIYNLLLIYSFAILSCVLASTFDCSLSCLFPKGCLCVCACACACVCMCMCARARSRVWCVCARALVCVCACVRVWCVCTRACVRAPSLHSF